jgi:hypothetical protein
VTNYSNKAEIWARPLANGDHAVVLFNGNSVGPVNITVDWTMIGLPASADVHVRDLWQRLDIGNFTGSYSTENLPPTDVQLLRVKCLSNCA